MARDPIKNLQWNKGGRPPTDNKVVHPAPNSGSDGDIQIKQTPLGAKLFGKIGGRWYHAPLAVDDTTRFGTGTQDQLIITNDSVDVLKDGAKVSTFGSEVIIGEVGSSKSNVQITAGAIKLRNNTTTKLQIAADGTISFPDSAKIIMGSGVDDNIVISSSGANDAGTYNAVFGIAAGTELLGSSVGNTIIGGTAGTTVTSGDYNICIGVGSAVAVGGQDKGIAIGYTVSAAAKNIKVGDNSYTANLDFSTSSSTWAPTSDERIKKDIVDSDLGLSFINALKPIKYVDKTPFDWPNELNHIKDDERSPDSTKVLDGFTSQQVKSVMDDMGVTFSGWSEDDNSLQRLQYAKFVVPLTKAVQELSAKIDTIQTEINNLKEG